MSTHKHIDKICCVVLVLTLLLSTLFMFGEALGIETAARVIGYENRLFSTDRVHTIDIIIDDWDAFLSTATSEVYSLCSVVIDGEAIKNVGIRGKGNTSLSNVSSMGSSRYSFKIEFDQYDNTKSYHGLDKLSLNNVIQDNTYMKDYLTYQMMNEFGVSAPLCSYAYITVNSEDWGLYLAVEGVEDAFLNRNYGYDHGELYKPDSLSFGGGRGNGKDFNMSDFTDENGDFNFSFDMGENTSGTTPPSSSGIRENSSSTRPSRENMGNFGDMFGGNMGNFGDMFGGGTGTDEDTSGKNPPGNMGGFGGMFGMGSSDVKLQYIDDNPSSYSNIFGSAKTDLSEEDQSRLIASLRQLSSYEDLEEVVDIEAVIRYFIVHNFVVNGDSYTGSMIHNYYLYEEDGKLSMIPWDYNLAFGTFQSSNGTSSVNTSIDEVLTDRPMQAWIFSDETYSEMYYELYAEMLETVDIQSIIDNAYNLIASYVQKDPTAFCTYEQFETGVQTMKDFCALRSENVALQLAGSTETVNAGNLNISSMGTMGGGFGGGRGDSSTGNRIPGNTSGSTSELPSGETPSTNGNTSGTRPSMGGNATSGTQTPWDGTMNGGFTGNWPSDFWESVPNGNMPSGNGGSTNRPSIGSSTQQPANTNDSTLLIVSIAVLVAGIAFAALFQRRKCMK